MIKMRIEFLSETDLNRILKLVEQEFIIVDKGEIKESKRANSKLRLIYVELVKK